MPSLTKSANLFQRIIKPAQGGELGRELAEYVRSLDFDEADKVRYLELSAKAQTGELTPDDEDELDSFLHIDTLLAILRLKAERSRNGAHP